MVRVKEDPHSDVKFSLEYQQRPFDVFLDDEGVMLDFVRRRAFLFYFVRRW